MIPQWMRALSHHKSSRAQSKRPAIHIGKHREEQISPPMLLSPWEEVELPGGRVVIRVAASQD